MPSLRLRRLWKIPEAGRSLRDVRLDMVEIFQPPLVSNGLSNKPVEPMPLDS